MAENTQTSPPPAPPRTRLLGPAVIALLLLVPALFLWRVAQVRSGDEVTVPVALEPTREAVPVAQEQHPPLEEGDALLQRLVAGWSKDPRLQQLSLRHLVAAVELVAAGESPKPALPFLSISGAFTVREEGRAGRERRFMTKASFARYDPMGKLVGSIDAAAAGAAYAQLRPYCLTAFAELGRPGKRLDDQLTLALRRLIDVRVPEGEVELVPKGAVYAFADPTLEGLSAAEKQVLRMGPSNARVLQRQLAEFARRAQLDPGPDVR